MQSLSSVSQEEHVSEAGDKQASETSSESVQSATAHTFGERAKIGMTAFGRAAWAYIKHAKIELIVLFGLLVLDLVTKALIGKFMYVGQSIELIPDFLYITYVRNTKAAFGSAFGLEKIMSDNAIRIIFLIITVIAVAVFCYLLYRLRKRHILMRLSVALIISGALGNFFDRLVLHYVRDFVEFVFFGCSLPLLGESFPVFNVADIGLTVGVILFLVYFVVFYKDPKPKSGGEKETVASSAGEGAGEANVAADGVLSDTDAEEKRGERVVQTQSAQESIEGHEEKDG